MVPAHPASAFLFAGAFAVISAVAVAQEGGHGQPPHEEPGFFGSISNWFSEQASNFSDTFKNTGKKVENFGHDAGLAARTTVETAKDAADAVARLPGTRVIRGHEKCKNAPNGAPDCVAAANTICKARGFESGKSLDMTTSEICPAKVLLSGRHDGAQCRDETFVSRVLCQ